MLCWKFKPGEIRPFVVLAVIAEVETGQQGKPTGQVQAVWPGTTEGNPLAAMGQVGAYQEKLQRTEQQGQGAEQQHIDPACRTEG